ncbi:acyl-homoserine-lactone synthase [Rhodopseudomonas boonkerdii]|uniref:acyl-homoserine-lactone synthase n=1 Tax=Rhodopseudomonas boonkerdii TaxID=475937 RepID=UPI001E3FF54D|nr:acyl-homoserine-lactone synthase [Rhodopseudomonas boonkerdii]
MIEIIDSGNAGYHRDLLDKQFRLRHEIFVGERGWTDFDIDGTHERDQYDDDAAVYLVAADEIGTVAGGYRLYPTVLPHMLSEQFPHLVEGAIIRRHDVLELTRFAMRKSQRRSRHYFELLAAIQEYGMMEGLSGFTSVINPLRIPILQSFGFEIEPLGLPAMIDGDSTIAVLFHVNEQCHARVRDKVAIHDTVFGAAKASRQRASAR